MWAHRTPHQPALFMWRPCNPLRSEVSKPLSDNKRPTKERKEWERDTRLHSLHKSWMKTVFFCNLIWEMLIERRGWEGVGGGRGSAPSAASIMTGSADWLLWSTDWTQSGVEPPTGRGRERERERAVAISGWISISGIWRGSGADNLLLGHRWSWFNPELSLSVSLKPSCWRLKLWISDFVQRTTFSL